MCINCIGNTETYMAGAALAAEVLRAPVHRMVAACGVVRPADPWAHSARTVEFLQALALDPVEILGMETVLGVAAWRAAAPSPRPRPVAARVRDRIGVRTGHVAPSW